MNYTLLFITLVQCVFLCGLSEQEMKDYKNALLKDTFAQIVKFIKKYGVNVTLDDEKNTPLHIVASRTITDEEKKLPLSKRSDVRIIKYLVNGGADVNAKNVKGQTPSDFADYNRKFDVQDYLTGSGRVMWSILERKAPGDIEIVIDALPDEINSQDIRGNTPLHYAAGRGNQAVINLLLERGANPYVKNNAGLIPKDFAAAFGKKNVAAFLDDMTSHDLYYTFNKDLMTIWVLQ